MVDNVITVSIGNSRKITARPAWLTDKGMILRFVGVELPNYYVVDFARSLTEQALPVIGTPEGVAIPSELFHNSDKIFAWLRLTQGDNVHYTVYQITIPLQQRSEISNVQPTPEQEDIIDQAIAALNVAMSATSADAAAALASERAAAASAQEIEDMTVSAETLPTGSEASVEKSIVDDVVHLSFGLPRGEQGVQGPTGATPNLTIGTVQTLQPTQNATATITGTPENPVLNLGIPKGNKGDTGNGISTITKTGTSGLVDTYTITFTNGDTTTFTVTNGEDGEVTTAQMNAAIETALEDYAKVDGSYASLTAGNAEQLVATVGVNDKTPYLFRTTGGSADVGDRVKLSEITGGTVAWNQLTKEMNSTNFVRDIDSTTVSISNGIAEVLPSVQYGGVQASSSNRPTIIDGHKYFGTASVMSQNGLSVFITVNTAVGNVVNASNNWSEIHVIANGDTTKNNTVRIRTNTKSNFTTFYVKNVMVFDLTAMFGSTIADYIYSLEQANAGAGVAWFRKLFPKPYYAYDSGSLQSVNTSAHKMVGFNQWDEEWENGIYGNGNLVTAKQENAAYIRCKNPIRVLPNTVYYFKVPNYYSDYARMRFYDADGNSIGYIGTSSNRNATFTTPENCYWMVFWTGERVGPGVTYNHDICINISWDGERDGEYEPYEEHTYALDSDLELRGILKLDALNNLYYDGDRYLPDGTVERRYGIVDLSTLDWSDSTSARYISKPVSGMKPCPNSSETPNIVAEKYRTIQWRYGLSENPDAITVSNDSNAKLYLYKDANTSTPSGYLVYELATPTTESADPYQETQICDDFGTEEFVDSRTVPMPVGANALYQANLRAKLEMAPDSPSGNGDYIVRQTDGLNEYVLLEKELPTAPAEDGTYSLKCTVASGTATLSWVADT